jgi:hypothetical protein
MSNTTGTEDYVIHQCRLFGGAAQSCADIVARLDLVIDKLRFTICNMETDIERLEAELEKLDRQKGEA